MSVIDSVLMTALSELTYEYARSSGAGGQNVNKVNSKVVLRWNVADSRLPAEIKIQLLDRLRHRLTSEGELIIASETQRDQPANKRSCLEKLNKLLDEALKIQKVRKPTRPTKSSKRKRLESKKQQQEKKQSRKRIF